MNIVVPLGVAAVAIALIALWTDWKQERRHRRPISRRVRRVASKHRGETGLVAQVFWPVAPRAWSLSVNYVTGTESRTPRWFARGRTYFFGSAVGRRRPFWVAMTPGRHDVTLRADGERPQEKAMRIDLDCGEHKVMLCWPSKRRVVTRERPLTEWQLVSLPEDA